MARALLIVFVVFLVQKYLVPPVINLIAVLCHRKQCVYRLVEMAVVAIRAIIYYHEITLVSSPAEARV